MQVHEHFYNEHVCYHTCLHTRSLDQNKCKYHGNRNTDRLHRKRRPSSLYLGTPTTLTPEFFGVTKSFVVEF
jgi:hypothetical protein